MHPAPELPVAYELAYFDSVNCLRDKAVELARQGAEEGTLLWAAGQDNARARLGQTWQCNPGDLHCSILLRPDFVEQSHATMLVVAAVSLGNAIASFVSPMISLGYGWPNDLLIATSKFGALWVDRHSGENPPWLVLTASVNIRSAPSDAGMDAISLVDADTSVDINPSVLLEAYAREFLKQINNWSDRGEDYILRQWTPRLRGLDDPVCLKLEDETIEGIFSAVDENGNARVRTEDGQHRKVSIARYMEIGA